MITPDDKKKVLERLDVFDQLLEEDEFVQKQRALGREEGLAEGLAIGATKIARQTLVNVVQIRFPSLENLARQKAELTQRAEDLSALTNAIVAAADEASARAILSSSPAA